VRAYPSFASAETFVGWLNQCQGIAEGDSFSYGVEVNEHLSETKGDALLSSHGLYGLI
jgi:hypothetical protein